MSTSRCLLNSNKEDIIHITNIIENIIGGKIDAEIVCVVSNKADAYALERAKKYNIPTYILDSSVILQDKNKREAYNRQLAKLMKKISPDIGL